MDPVSLALGGAGLISSAFSFFGQKEANKQNRREAETNRDWQERMSSSAHQREVEDLKKAGLNPVLSAYNKGASTGTGAQATILNPAKDVPQNMINSALAKATIKLTNAKARNENNKANLSGVVSDFVTGDYENLLSMITKNSSKAVKRSSRAGGDLGYKLANKFHFKPRGKKN